MSIVFSDQAHAAVDDERMPTMPGAALSRGMARPGPPLPARSSLRAGPFAGPRQPVFLFGIVDQAPVRTGRGRQDVDPDTVARQFHGHVPANASNAALEAPTSEYEGTTSAPLGEDRTTMEADPESWEQKQGEVEASPDIQRKSPVEVTVGHAFEGCGRRGRAEDEAAEDPSARFPPLCPAGRDLALVVSAGRRSGPGLPPRLSPGRVWAACCPAHSW